MNYQQTVELLSQGKTKWNQWAKNQASSLKILQAELVEARNNSFEDEDIAAELAKEQARSNIEFYQNDLQNADFSELDFPGSLTFNQVRFFDAPDFSKCEINGNLTFNNCAFGSGTINLQRATLRGKLIFINQVIDKKIELEGSRVFQGLDIRNQTITVEQDFSSCRLQAGWSSNFDGLIANAKIDFSNLVLKSASFRGASLPAAEFVQSDLSGANFEGANCENGNFSGCKVDGKTVFNLAALNDVEMDRYTLDCMENHGGISNGQLMRMKIADDVARMRDAFGGLTGYVYFASFATFLAPYALFTFERWSDKRSLEGLTDSTIQFLQLWLALLRYIWSGGTEWKSQAVFHPAFCLFAVMAIFHLVRLFLILKTQRLEQYHAIRGYRDKFSLSDRIDIPLANKMFARSFTWALPYNLVNYGKYVYLIALVWNTLFFMSTPIPILPDGGSLLSEYELAPQIQKPE